VGKAGEKELLLRSLDRDVLTKLIDQLPNKMGELARLFYLTVPRPSYKQMAITLGCKKTSIPGRSTPMRQRMVLLHRNEYKSKRPVAKAKVKAPPRTSWITEFHERFFALSLAEQTALASQLGKQSRKIFVARYFPENGSPRPNSRQLAEHFGCQQTLVTSLLHLARKKLHKLLRLQEPNIQAQL
jgi:hypothetical protein